MLPDFPDLKSRVKSIVTQRLRQTFHGEAPVLSRIPRFLAHEGDSLTIHRPDGSVSTTSYRETAAQFQIDKKELSTLSPKELIAKIDRAASEMAEKASRTFYDELRKTTSETGRVVDSQGSTFSPDLFLQVLEMIDIDFDQHGKPTGLTFVVPPEIGNRIRELGPQWEADPEFKKRHNELMEKKREAWRDRESRRKLVD